MNSRSKYKSKHSVNPSPPAPLPPLPEYSEYRARGARSKDVGKDEDEKPLGYPRGGLPLLINIELYQIERLVQTFFSLRNFVEPFASFGSKGQVAQYPIRRMIGIRERFKRELAVSMLVG